MGADVNVLAAVLGMIAVFVVPGAVLNKLSGLNSVWSVAASIPTSFGLFGLIGWSLSKLSISYGIGSFIVCYVLICSIAMLWRAFFRPKTATAEQAHEEAPYASERGGSRLAKYRVALGEKKVGSLFEASWIIPFVGVAGAAWYLISTFLKYFDQLPQELGGLYAIFQGWDVHWHASEVRFIIEEGIADPTRMGELRNIVTQDPLYYPSAWHAGVALATEVLGIHPVVGLNLAAFILPAILLPLSTALIAWRLVNDGTMLAQIGAALAAVAVVFAPSVFWIGYLINAFPYVAAICMTGIVATLWMTVPAHPKRAVAAALGFMGMVMVHPASVTVVVLMLAIWWLANLLFRPTNRVATDSGVQARLRDFGVLAITGAVSVVLLLPQLMSGTSQADEVLGWQTENQVTRFQSWTAILGMGTKHSEMFDGTHWAWAFFLAAIGGLVVVNWSKNIWAPIYLVVATAIGANAMLPFFGIAGEVLSLVSSIHYSAGQRLIMPVTMMIFAATGIGLAAIIRTACMFFVKSKTAQQISKAASVVVAGVAAIVMVAALSTAIKPGADAVFDASYNGRVVSPADVKAFQWLSEQPHAYDGLILGDTTQGYGWMYTTNGLPSMARHYLYADNLINFNSGANPTDETANLLRNLTKLGTGTPENPDAANDIDRIAQNLDINYIYVSAPSFWPFQEQDFPEPVDVENTRGVTLLYRDAEVWIYAVNNKFTDEEISQMRQQSPGPLAPLPSYGALNKTLPSDVVRDGDTNPWNYNFYFRPEGL